jgi:deoxyribonuclease IV
MSLLIGCHVSAAGGIWNAPANAKKLECETFQIFTRPPQGGPASDLNDEVVGKFQEEMKKHGYTDFVVHAPYFVNFGSAEPRIFHGSSSVVKQELERANALGAKYMMTHLGTSKALGQEKAFEQTQKGLTKVLEGYEGKTTFLLEIAAGAGEVIGDTFEELAELMEPLLKFKGFGGICFDTQHAFSSGYDLRTTQAVDEVFKKFDRIIGLKYLKMSHMNDSKVELGGRKDRHEHIGDGLIGKGGFSAILQYLQTNLKSKILNLKSSEAFCLILETEHDKVEEDIQILKTLRDKI